MSAAIVLVGDFIFVEDDRDQMKQHLRKHDNFEQFVTEYYTKMSWDGCNTKSARFEF